MDLDTNILPNEDYSQNLDKYQRPAAVRQIDPFEDGLVLPSLKDNLAIDGIPIRFSGNILIGEPLPEVNIISEEEVRNNLLNIANSFEDSPLINQFNNKDLSTAQLVRVLAYASESQYLEFMNLIVGQLEESEYARDFLLTKFDNALHFASIEEKILLAVEWLNEPNSYEIQALSSLIRSAESTEELNTLVSVLGEESLKATGDLKIIEYLALNKIISAYNQLSSPSYLDSANKDLDIDYEIEKIRGYLFAQQQALIDISSDYSKSNIMQDYFNTNFYNQEYLEIRLEECKTDKEKVNLLNLFLKKISLEIEYGVILTDTTNDPNGQISSWDIEKLRQVETALKLLPEGVLLTTPKLFQVGLVPQIGNSRGILGLRHKEGMIYLAEHAFSNASLEALYPAVKSGTAVLVHEIGHAIQLGEGWGGMTLNPDGTWQVLMGDQRYDFDEYMEWTGWEIIQPDKYELTNAGYSVEIDGEEYLLNTPVRVNGELKIIVIVNGFLFMHNAEGQYTIDPYGRTNPYEDWAEGFTEYILNPSRLKKFANEKFEHFEREFQVYGK